VNKQDQIKEFKRIHEIKRLTEESIYRVAEKLGYRDLRGFHHQRYALGSWNKDKTSSRTVCLGDSKEYIINFLMSGYLHD